MLSKRTNILFEENVFRHLASLAAKQKTSVGNLVRNAVSKIYLRNNHSKKTSAYNKIITVRKSVKKINALDIKEFIEYGRPN